MKPRVLLTSNSKPAEAKSMPNVQDGKIKKMREKAFNFMIQNRNMKLRLPKI